MKKIKQVFVLFLVACAILGSASCKKKNNNSGNFSEEKTIRIAYALAGYGDSWIKQAVSLFNQVFESQGYHAVIDRDDPNASETEINEIKYPEDNQFDLYFDINDVNWSNLIDSSYSVLKNREQSLLECLDDVYNSPAIDTKGNEESGTILENLSPAVISYLKYNGNANEKFVGKTYRYQWTSAVSGLAVNTEVLAKYGLEVPRTTNELKKACDTILGTTKKATNGNTIYPMTWPGYNASGYMAYALLTWLAQWQGVEGYNNFYALIPATGDTKTNGYDVYNDIGIQYAIATADTFVNTKYACNGTLATIDHLTSNQILADGEAAFCITGDWFYNELINCDYSEDELKCVQMMATPVMSELADKIGLPGATADAKDQVLSSIIDYIDNGKSDSEIVGLVAGVSADQVAKVREARGIYFDSGLTHSAFIPSYANAKEGAKLFLRFIASKDFAQTIYGRYAHGVTANQKANVTGSNHLTALSKITKQSYSTPVGFADHLSKIRVSGAISFVLEPVTSWPDLIKGLAGDVNGYTAEDLYIKIKDGMQKNWDSIIITSGVYDED